MLSRVMMTSLVLGCRAPHVHSLVRPCDGSLFPFNLLLLFVVHLLSFKSLVIEVAVAVLLLVSLLFILLRSFGRGALWIALLVLFSLFLHLFSTRVWGDLCFVAFLGNRTGIANGSLQWITLHMLGRVLGKGEIHSLFFYSTLSVQSRFGLEYPFSYSPLSVLSEINTETFGEQDASAIRDSRTPKIELGGS